MARKKKPQVDPDVISEMIDVIQEFNPCEWVVQFDNDEPVVFTDNIENTTNKQVVITLGNNSNSFIKFTDPNTGKFFKLYARQKQV